MILTTFLAAGLAFAAPPPNKHIVHEVRSIGPYVSELGQRVSPNTTLRVRFALKQQNLHRGYDHLLDVSHPGSSNFGNHWTIERVNEEFSPSEESVSAVIKWLRASGIDGDIVTSNNKIWVGVDLATSQAEQLLKTEYYKHSSDEMGNSIACDLYHLPAHVAEHIDYVKPGIAFRTSPNMSGRNMKRGSNAKAPSPPTCNPETVVDLIKKQQGIIQPQLQMAELSLLWGSCNQSGAIDRLRTIGKTLNETATCGDFITPACLRALYGIPKAHLNDSINSLGIYESIGLHFDQQDLNYFFAAFAPDVPIGTGPHVISINNATARVPVANYSSQTFSEPLLDLDVAYALTYPQTVTLYQTGETAKQAKHDIATEGIGFGNFHDLLAAIDGSYCTPLDKEYGNDCGTAKLTRVLSVSYGSPELEIPEKQALAFCNEMMKLGLQGHTIVFASGDYGVGGSPPGKKTSNACIDPKNLLGPKGSAAGYRNGTVFNPSGFAACPYVLSVGATQLKPGQTVEGPESVMNVQSNSRPGLFTFSSSGGFSNYHTAPSYQQKALATYFSGHGPGYKSYEYNGTATVGANGGKYNRCGRGFPDVSANGVNFMTFGGGKPSPVDGTSVAAPIWASIITRINQERTVVGKGPVGFVNPSLYSHPEVFNDITHGHNAGCQTDGFTAVDGWDPVTGLGTPKYSGLLKLFMSLP